MPHRLVSVAILIFWLIAAFALFLRDLLPDIIIGKPPDLRTIAQAEDDEGPTKWAILVPDFPGSHNLRSVGQVTTETKHKRDGWVGMSSHAWFDSGELLKGTVFSTVQSDRIGIVAGCDIDPSGNLDNFRAGVRLSDSPKMEVLTLEGRLRKDRIEVQANSMIPLLRWKGTFPYQPRGMVQTTLSPLERMPGLQVGQRWRSEVVSPITGRVETATVSVVGKEHITWDNNPVLCLVVKTEMTPLSAKTWVRPDGLVLSQEVPLPFVTMILDRQPKRDQLPSKPGGRRR